MKKNNVLTHNTIHLSILVAITLSVLITTAHAQEDVPFIPQNTVTAEEKGVDEQGAGRTLTTQTQDRFINLISNIVNRTQAAVDRLDNIADRIDSRILKMNTEGFDTTSAQAALAIARANLATVHTTLETLPSPDSAIRGNTPRESFILIRTQLWSTKNTLKETQRNLRETVRLLKEASAPTPDTANLDATAEEAVTNSD